MNFRIFLTFLLFALSFSIAMAKTHPKVTQFALEHCNYQIFPNEDDRIDCVTDIVNCVIVNGGETDLTKLTPACLNKKAQERKHEQRL